MTGSMCFHVLADETTDGQSCHVLKVQCASLYLQTRPPVGQSCHVLKAFVCKGFCVTGSMCFLVLADETTCWTGLPCFWPKHSPYLRTSWYVCIRLCVCLYVPAKAYTIFKNKLVRVHTLVCVLVCSCQSIHRI